MVVYIEYVLIDNIVINFLLFLFTQKVLKLDIKKRSILLCSVLGALFALIMPFIAFYGLVLFLFKLFVGAFLVSLLKKYTSIREYFVTLLTFLTATFLFGGLTFFVLNVLNAETTNSGLLIYNYHLPVGIIIVIIYLYSYFMFQLIKNFYKRKTVSTYVYDVRLKQGSKEVYAKAFLDTGNMLVDNETGKPIIMVNYNIFESLCDNINPTDLILGKLENMPLKNCKYMNTMGANGKSGKILLFEADELKIFLDKSVNIIPSAMLGLALIKYRDVLEYSVLLNPSLF